MEQSVEERAAAAASISAHASDEVTEQCLAKLKTMASLQRNIKAHLDSVRTDMREQLRRHSAAGDNAAEDLKIQAAVLRTLRARLDAVHRRVRSVRSALESKHAWAFAELERERQRRESESHPDGEEAWSVEAWEKNAVWNLPEA
ncbi:hypothetical protein H632_c311p0 [Helicosporidium sp. ATCC 50920]|nr:hypothetical protein H632_c311p0 [Helicosporidium sp. ATCC 50920]|eukprot:KDD76216.1 hypothetical protein H632_c311p0 [Helicosporidium sp. ATCC 50920]